MADEKPPPPDVEAPADDVDAAPADESSRAPAVQGSELWGGKRRIEGLPGMPVVETKDEYFRLLNDAGLRMQDQQESVTGPAREGQPDIDALAPPPSVEVRPLSQAEAHVVGAFTAVLKRHGLKETIWCNACFSRGRASGARLRFARNQVLLECRCGAAVYNVPVGTTDLVLSRLPNIPAPERTGGSIMTGAGPMMRPTVLLHDAEALLIRRHLSVLRARDKDTRLFHDGCFSGNPWNEDEALAIKVTPQQIVMICPCRTLFHQSVAVAPASTRIH